MSEEFRPYTPGWNDPPSYSFEDTVSAQQENRPKIFNRIPARLLPSAQGPQSNVEKNQVCLEDNIDSIQNSDVSTNSTVTSSSSCDIPMEERLSYVMNSLNESIKKSMLPEAKKLDVSKRLSRLEISWKNSQFTDTIQQKTIALVQAIETDNYEEANKLQMALMVDHTRQCNTWIPAIRQLINQHT